MNIATAAEAGPRGAEIAYEAIAPVYDEFTAHHDYDLWLGNLMPELKRCGLRGNRLLDVGCGTGKSFIWMLERDWEVTACDISPSMVELARAKVGDAARLSVADMRELPVFGEFDLVWCLDDAVNYLLSADELERALAGMRRNLAPGGLLMFDVNLLGAYRGFFAETHVVESEGRQLLWQGRASADTPPGSICEASFEVLDADGRRVIDAELHRQRHFPQAELLEVMERAGLECLDVFGHSIDAVLKQPVDELAHVKAVFIARAADQNPGGEK
jgi:SAM-dependent methyltransferase